MNFAEINKDKLNEKETAIERQPPLQHSAGEKVNGRKKEKV